MKETRSQAVGALVWVVVLATASMFSSDPVRAGNMGFRMNKGIAPLGIPAPRGQNWVALPFTNAYANAQDVCVALGLTPASGRVLQIIPTSGVTASHTCGNAGPFLVNPRLGVIVSNPVAVAGVISGSHPSGLAGVSLAPLAAPAPRGRNLYPVPYNQTACDAQDLCVQLALPAGMSRILRVDATTGLVASHNCGDAGPFPLVLGEAVEITFTGAAPIVVPSVPHF